VSFSLTGASSVATDTAGIILMDQGLIHMVQLFDLADKFNNNMNTGFAMILVPAAMGVVGVILFGFGVVSTVWLNISGLGLGVFTAMTPLMMDWYDCQMKPKFRTPDPICRYIIKI